MRGWKLNSIFAFRLNNFITLCQQYPSEELKCLLRRFVKLALLADAAKQRGIHVYHLNIGQPDLPTPRAALDAIRNIDRTVLEYSPSQGYRSYREKLVGYYKKIRYQS